MRVIITDKKVGDWAAVYVAKKLMSLNLQKKNLLF